MSNEVETFKYLIDLGLKLQDQSSFYWNFLVVGQIAVVGWILERGAKLSRLQRGAIALVFGIFLLMNAWGLSSSNLQKDVVLRSAQELAETQAVKDAFPETFVKAVQQTPESNWYPLKFWGIWVPSNLIVFLVLFWNVMPARTSFSLGRDTQK